MMEGRVNIPPERSLHLVNKMYVAVQRFNRIMMSFNVIQEAL